MSKLMAGDVLENAHGARFRLEEDELDDVGRVRAITVPPVRATRNAYAIGATTWIDVRDIGRGLEVVECVQPVAGEGR